MDTVQTKTVMGTKPVDNTEAGFSQQQEDIRIADKVGFTTGKPERSWQEFLNAISNSIKNFAKSNEEDNGEDQEDDEDNTELGNLNEENDHSRVIGTIA